MKTLHTRLITTDKDFYKSLVSLALPIALQHLVSFLITLTDSIMIGQLGESATAGAYVGSLVFTVLRMLITGVEGGIAVAVSRCWGKGDTDKIKRISAAGAYLSIAFGVCLALPSLICPELIVSFFLSDSGKVEGAEYLRALAPAFIPFVLSCAPAAILRSIESPRVATLASSSGFVLNLLFDYLLIFGKLGFTKMSVTGAAIATFIAYSAELLILLIYLFLFDKKLSMRPRDLLAVKKSTAISFLGYTTPIILGQAVWIFNTLFSSFVLSDTGSAAVAAVAVASTLNSLSYVLMNGLSGAVGIIIGKTIGEGRIDRIKEYSYTTEAIFILLGIITSAMLFFTRYPFVSLYNVGEDAARIAVQLISVLALTVIGTSYQSACLGGLVKSGGDVSFIFKNDAFFIFLIVLPLSITAVRLGAPLWLVFLALKSDQILKCIPAAIKINRFGWIKRL